MSFHSSQHVGRHSSSVSHHKRPCHRCLGWLCVQGSAIAAFNPLAAKGCMLHKQGFSSSVCQVVAGAISATMIKV